MHSAGRQHYAALLATPFGYAPVVGTFFAMYVAIELLLPYRNGAR